MADYDSFKPILGELTYITKYDEFVTASETVATEIENAREEESDLVTNITSNYAKYTLADNIDGQALYGTADNASTQTTLYDTGADFSNVVVGEYIINRTETLAASGVPVYETIQAVYPLESPPRIVTTSNLNTSWSDDDYCISKYKATNMPSPISNNDYATKGYVLGLTGDAAQEITAVGTGELQANDIIVVNEDGDALTGRPTNFNVIRNSSSVVPLEFNDNVLFDATGGSFYAYLPQGTTRVGGIVSFADILGTVSTTNTFTIYPHATEKIMGLSAGEGLVIDQEFSRITFSLLYTGASFGWCIINLQR